MKRIFLTGATGVMGTQGLIELAGRPERYEITVLARDSSGNRKKLAPFIEKGVRVVWGDLLDKKAVAEGVKDADIVLHVGGLVSPQADWYPDRTIQVNVGSMRNILEAALPRKEDVAVVYIGSVSQYGPRYVPHHWGQSGDPLRPAVMDAYAYSKAEAERLLMESGISKWVSLRQTAILHPGLLKKAADPITFHVPVHGVIEWVSAEDSGRLLERVCRDEVPASFWRKAYNIGGGESYRLTNYEFESRMLQAVGCPPPEKVFDANWFATRNFHGFWFSDSEELEDILHFRSGKSFSDVLDEMKKDLPWYYGLAPLAPAFILKAFMRKVASTPELGPLWWLKTGCSDKIEASWGSMEEWQRIPSWKDMDLGRPSVAKPDVRPRPVMSREEEDSEEVVRCPECGFEYRIRKLTRAAGHGCPECLRNRMRMENIDGLI